MEAKQNAKLVVIGFLLVTAIGLVSAAGYCGDGTKNQIGETCDDGNRVSGDGCNAVCQREYCGDGIKQPTMGETCDGPMYATLRDPLYSWKIYYVLFTDKHCDNTCQIVSGPPTCGDGMVNQVDGGLYRFGNGITETCDDGNLVSNDGCSASCKREFCGDSIKQPSEQCDDGNTVTGDGCSRSCKIEYCGDNQVQQKIGEQCDGTRYFDTVSKTVKQFPKDPVTLQYLWTCSTTCSIVYP